MILMQNYNFTKLLWTDTKQISGLNSNWSKNKQMSTVE